MLFGSVNVQTSLIVEPFLVLITRLSSNSNVFGESWRNRTDDLKLPVLLVLLTIVSSGRFDSAELDFPIDNNMSKHIGSKKLLDKSIHSKLTLTKYLMK